MGETERGRHDNMQKQEEKQNEYPNNHFTIKKTHTSMP